MTPIAIPDRPANPELDRRVLTAAKRCLAAKLYPSEANLRHRGATGDRGHIVAALDRLIDSGKLELPPWAAEKRKRALAIRDGLSDRVPPPASRPIPEALLSPRVKPAVSAPKADKGLAKVRPVDGRERPCRTESRDYWKAWKSLASVARTPDWGDGGTTAAPTARKE